MKKGLIVAFGLMAIVLLSGCGNKEVNTGKEVKTLDDMQWSLSFTMDELDVLEEKLFPVSYVYTTYQNEDWVISWSGEYVYLADDKYLLPVEGHIVTKEISSSEVNNAMVYSTVDAKLDDGSTVSILYINDPETLKYSFATLYAENETTLYTFNY